MASQPHAKPARTQRSHDCRVFIRAARCLHGQTSLGSVDKRHLVLCLRTRIGLCTVSTLNLHRCRDWQRQQSALARLLLPSVRNVSWRRTGDATDAGTTSHTMTSNAWHVLMNNNQRAQEHCSLPMAPAKSPREILHLYLNTQNLGLCQGQSPADPTTGKLRKLLAFSSQTEQDMPILG